MQATASGPNQHYSNDGEAAKTQPIARHALRTALRLAEKSAQDCLTMLREAENQRDALVRRLSEQQARVDAMVTEHQYLTRHVRDVEAARDAD